MWEMKSKKFYTEVGNKLGLSIRDDLINNYHRKDAFRFKPIDLIADLKRQKPQKRKIT